MTNVSAIIYRAVQDKLIHKKRFSHHNVITVVSVCVKLPVQARNKNFMISEMYRWFFKC